MLTNTKGGACMAGRPLRLLLLAIVIELFAVVSVFAVGGLAAFAFAVIGLVVALVGFSARE
jgi:hypothetical protein